METGLPWKTADVAAVIDTILGDRRGWVLTGKSFQRTPSARLRIRLATPATVDKLCAPLKTGGEVSCRNGDPVVLNAKRWKLGIEAYSDQSISMQSCRTNPWPTANEIAH